VTRKLSLGWFGLSALGMIVPLFGADAAKQPSQVTSTEHTNFAPGGVIHVNHSDGDLNVEGWDRPEVEVTVTKSLARSGQSKSPDQDERRLESIHVVTDHNSPTELTISTTLVSRHGRWAPPLPATTRNGVRLEYGIHVPRDSRLVIHHGVGSVLVTNVSGDVEATAHRGDIVLMLADSDTYSIDARSKFGTVSSDFAGVTSLARYRLGERFANSTPSSPRRIYLRMGFGGITIKAIPPEARPRVAASAE
jgi:hypothetical protein